VSSSEVGQHVLLMPDLMLAQSAFLQFFTITGGFLGIVDSTSKLIKQWSLQPSLPASCTL
jgi:hypothetical protein